MKYGLKKEEWEAIQEILGRFTEVGGAILYGSRAKGNFRYNSDIDLALTGTDLDLSILYRIETALDDLLLPYKIDLSIFHSLKNKSLKDHIRRRGIMIYNANKPVSI